MTERCFLTTYHPLIKKAGSRKAARENGLRPFIDGSCRREPDLECRYPSITAICRAGKFAPRLCIGDRIAYLTVKGRYFSDCESGWRLVAVLRVAQRFSTHEEAAAWYLDQGLRLPINCLVANNPPMRLEFTIQNPLSRFKRQSGTELDPVRMVQQWDAKYHQRVAAWPVFLATEILFLELNDPPQITNSQMRAIFNSIPATRNPPEIPCAKLDQLIQIAMRHTG